MTSTDYLPSISPAAIGWPVDTVPPVEHTGALWCDHSTCDAFRDVDGSVTSLKTFAIFDSEDGERVEVVRRDEWSVADGWKAGMPQIAGLNRELLLEHGTRIVSAALRAGVEMGATQR